MSVLTEMLLQMGYYFIVAFLVVMTFAVMMRGFLWKFIKVKTSFGKLILVKQRTILRDHFFVGWVENGFLLFNDKKDNKKYVARIVIDMTKSPVYQCIGVNWVDINEEKSAVCNPDYSVVSGFDTKKFSDLMTRCLQQPILASNNEKIIMILSIVVVLLLLGAIYLGFTTYDKVHLINEALPTLCRGVVTGGII
jgi:hypothetical protein